MLTWNPGSDAGVSASGDRPPNRRLAPTPTWSRIGVKQTRPTRLARVLRPRASLFHRQLTQCTIAELCPVYAGSSTRALARRRWPTLRSSSSGSQSDGLCRCSCSENRGERNRATDRTLSATVRAVSVIVLLGRAPRDAVTMPTTIAAATNNRDGDKRSFSNALAKNSAHTG